MAWINKTIINTFKITYVLIILIALTNCVVTADDDIIEIRPIKPLPNINLPSSPIPNGDVSPKDKLLLLQHGIIDSIGKDEQGRDWVVINDQTKYFSSNVKYFSSNGSSIPPFELNIGKQIGYLVNENREITELYLIDK